MLLAACCCQQAVTMSGYKFTPRAVASPDAPQKPLVRKRARSGGAGWVQIGLTIQLVMLNKQQFVRKLRILTRNHFWDVSRWLAGTYESASDHLDQHKKPVLIRGHKIKWLDFGTTPDEGNLSPHPPPGFCVDESRVQQVH